MCGENHHTRWKDRRGERHAVNVHIYVALSNIIEIDKDDIRENYAYAYDLHLEFPK